MNHWGSKSTDTSEILCLFKQQPLFDTGFWLINLYGWLYILNVNKLQMSISANKIIRWLNGSKDILKDEFVSKAELKESVCIEKKITPWNINQNINTSANTLIRLFVFFSNKKLEDFHWETKREQTKWIGFLQATSADIHTKNPHQSYLSKTGRGCSILDNKTYCNKGMIKSCSATTVSVCAAPIRTNCSCTQGFLRDLKPEQVCLGC